MHGRAVWSAHAGRVLLAWISCRAVLYGAYMQGELCWRGSHGAVPYGAHSRMVPSIMLEGERASGSAVLSKDRTQLNANVGPLVEESSQSGSDLS